MKNKLANFARYRAGEEVAGKEGNTLQDKLEIINRVIFGPNPRFWLNCKKMVKTMDDMWEIGQDWNGECRQIKNVLLYLSGETDERPASLAVYRAAEAVRDNIHELKTAYKNLPIKLFKGINEGNVEKVREVVDRGVDVNQIMNTTPYKHYPLEYAAYCGNPEIVKILLDAGADINVASENWHTALSSAFECRHRHQRENIDAIVKYLIDAGADVNQPAGGLKGYPPLSWALWETSPYPKTIKRLIDAGADITAEGHNEKLPIDAAIHNANYIWNDGSHNTAEGQLEIIKLLLDAGAEIENIQDSFCEVVGRNPLSMEFFLNELGADINAPGSRWGRTPLSMAVWRAGGSGTYPARFLVEHGADINAQDKNGDTPLMRAFDGNVTEIMEYLLQQGADPTIKNNKGETVVDIARKNDAEARHYWQTRNRVPLLKKYHAM